VKEDMMKNAISVMCSSC